VTSQNDEDAIIASLLRPDTPRTFIEIGWHPRENNTGALRAQGWTGMVYDAEHTGQYVSPGNLRSIPAWRKLPLGLLSIDIDGQDYHLLKAIMAAGLAPDIICVEYNAAFGPHAAVTVPAQEPWHWDGTDYFGASLRAFCTLMAGYGYALQAINGVNAFFGIHFPALNITKAWVDFAPHPHRDGPLEVV
jgi:hypothetical protein